MAIDLRTVLFAPDSAKSELVYNTSMSVSPFTGGAQVSELPGARWVLSFSYRNLSLDKSKLLKLTSARLRGGAEVAHVRDLSYIPVRQNELGAPVIDGAGQSGTSINISGWPPNTKVLSAGEQVSYLSTDELHRMHIVTSDVTTNANGEASVPVLPPMRNPPVDASPLNTTTPSFSARVSKQGSLSIEGMICNIDFEFTEALYGIQ